VNQEKLAHQDQRAFLVTEDLQEILEEKGKLVLKVEKEAKVSKGKLVTQVFNVIMHEICSYSRDSTNINLQESNTAYYSEIQWVMIFKIF